MTLAKRIRDCRYIKGWGPDELASRASISRTALYQIESGKTELPRAATLRRLARALDVSMEVLLGNAEPTSLDLLSIGFDAAAGPGRGPSWNTDEAPETSASRRDESLGGLPYAEGRERSLPVSPYLRPSTSRGELSKKFHDLLESPLGEQVVRFIEDAHRLIQPGQTKQAD